MSDGVPTDQWEQAAQLCRQAEESQKQQYFLSWLMVHQQR